MGKDKTVDVAPPKIKEEIDAAKPQDENPEGENSPIEDTTGGEHVSDALDEIKEAMNKRRFFTITDLFYLAAVDITADKHVYITRYPMTGYLGIFPSRIRVISTTETHEVEYNGKTYKHYPVIGKPDETPQFIEILRVANVTLKIMGGENSCRYSSNCGNISLGLNYSA
jgi:hypothetical protein